MVQALLVLRRLRPRLLQRPSRIAFRRSHVARFSVHHYKMDEDRSIKPQDRTKEKSPALTLLDTQLRQEHLETFNQPPDWPFLGSKRGWLKNCHPGDAIARIEETRTLLAQTEKLGLLIYCTTYSDDAKWRRFVLVFQALIRQHIEHDWDAEDHLQYMGWPVRDDRKQFENATTADVRKHFMIWRQEEASTRENRGPFLDDNDRELRLARPLYRHFIQVNEEAMESILACGSNELLDGWVNIVQAEWPPEDEFELKEMLDSTG